MLSINLIYFIFNWLSVFFFIVGRWSVIASQLPGRTDNDVKNYWNTKLKKRLNTTIKPVNDFNTTMTFQASTPPPPLSQPEPLSFASSSNGFLYPNALTVSNGFGFDYGSNFDPIPFSLLGLMGQEGSSSSSASSISLDSHYVPLDNGFPVDCSLAFPYDVNNGFWNMQERGSQVAANTSSSLNLADDYCYVTLNYSWWLLLCDTRLYLKVV